MMAPSLSGVQSESSYDESTHSGCSEIECAEMIEPHDAKLNQDKYDFSEEPTSFKSVETFADVGDFDSGHEMSDAVDSDPVDNFFLMARWQDKFARFQNQPLKKMSVAAKESKVKLTAGLKTVGEGARRVHGSVRLRRQLVQKKSENQLKRLLAKGQKNSKVRQHRHMIFFTLTMLDSVITAFWLGASPGTSYLWFTFKTVFLIAARGIWYKMLGDHYFLFDICYLINMLTLVYIWICPYSKEFFNLIYGFNGMLLIAIPLFRNSFVPHSIDKITSVSIHVSPVLQLWALRFFPADHAAVFQFPAEGEYSIKYSLFVYVSWAVSYVLYLFVFGANRIKRKGYRTLFDHMTINMGMLKLLPKKMQGPIGSRIAFVGTHFSLFAMGLPVMYMPFSLVTGIILACITAVFFNGAKFYITYFWKVYDDQIHAFERQLKQSKGVETKEDCAAKDCDVCDVQCLCGGGDSAIANDEQ